MGGGFDSGGYRSHEDILDRLSRPQRQSTWVPTKRDWRYATGVFSHADFEETPRNQTTWYDLDYDYNLARALQNTEQYTTIRGSDMESEDESTAEDSTTADRVGPDICTPRGPIPSQGEGVTPMLDRLHFRNGEVGVMDREIKNHPLPSSPPTFVDDDTMPSKSPPLHSVPARNLASEDNSMIPASPANLHPDEAWQDETHDFNMRTIRATLRDLSVKPSELVKNYNWCPEAVAVDALLSLGVPLSAKELCVYYPHHVRWQDVMVRLTHNDYRGPDILGIQAFFRGAYQDHMSPPVLNQIQRDAVQRLLPAFKTTSHEGRGDADINTNHLESGAYLEKKLKGYTVPTFDDLLRGLKFLPSGRDARGLTQCLAWYLDFCNTFTPKLELNVFHTQALIRALRQPLQPVVSQNLNRLALEQWQGQAKNEHHTAKCSRPQADFNIHQDSVDLKIHIHIPLRNILAFPFPALHGVVSEALELSIDKAERRRAARKGIATPAGHATADIIKRECTPKRPRQAELGELMTPARTPKRLRKLNERLAVPEGRMPKRLTVSPIMPRASTQQSGLTQPKSSPIKLEIGLRKRNYVYFES